MRLAIGGSVHRGDAIDLDHPHLSPVNLKRAIERAGPVGQVPETRTTEERTAGCGAVDGEVEGEWLRIDCRAPGAVHEHVGVIHPGMTVDPKRALAAAARSRGMTTPESQQLRDVRRELADIEIEPDETASMRRAVDRADADEQRLRESIATIRGRIQALEETNPESDRLAAARTELAETAREFSEVQTERLAAQQRLARAQQHARRTRNDRERRLRLQDRAANLQREATSALAERLYPEFRTELRNAPERRGDKGTINPETRSGMAESLRELQGDQAATAALAIGRLAELSAPIVLTTDHFETAVTANEWLETPVIKLES